jgi:uncharacterized protein YodC (DUF2158 family)
MKNGDYVRLKTGSPTMIVTYISSYNKVKLLWYDNGIKEAEVYSEYLEPVPKPSEEVKTRFQREWPL